MPRDGLRAFIAATGGTRNAWRAFSSPFTNGAIGMRGENRTPPAVEQPLRLLARRVQAAALQVTAFARQRQMVGHERRMQHHVAVDEDHVLAATGGDAQVAYARCTEADVLLPRMTQRYREIARESFDHSRRVLARTVVGHHHVQRARALPRNAVQAQRQRLFPVVGRDDQARGGQGASPADARILVHRLDAPI